MRGAAISDRSILSPNHGERAGGGPIDILLLHYTGMPSEDGALRWLADEKSQVSAHYVVREDGRVHQMVDEDRRAWHAGRSFWRGTTDVNSRSIGIEICNPGHEFGYRPFPNVQIEAVLDLCHDILARHPIERRNVLAHSDVAPARKEDPGEFFPWERFAEEGIGHFVEPTPIAGGRFFQRGDAGPPVQALQSMLALYGYGVPVSGDYCADTAAVVTAFQRHFRPERVDGIADMSSIDTLHRLLRALPRLD
jgi:N-acetylmuramoyl-L-alanine amidase